MSDESSAAAGAAGPVFVDATGRRGRLVGRVGVVVALLGLGYAVTLVVLSLIGVNVGAPGLPFVEHATRSFTGQSAEGQVHPAVVSTPAASDASATPTAGVGVTTGPRAAATPSATGAAGHVAHPTPSAAPSSAPTTAGPGRSSSAAGATNRPTTRPTSQPTSAPTTSGKSTSAPGQLHRPPH